MRRFSSLTIPLVGLFLVMAPGSPLGARDVVADSRTRTDALQDYLSQHGKPPADYLISTLADHRIVIVGENHWQRTDSRLIAAIVPELRRRNIALAMEVFPASRQADIDTLVAAPEWNQPAANDVMREAAWPYVQYRDILHEAWKDHIGAGVPPLRIIALGLPPDWRARKLHYDGFMADLVLRHATDDQHRVLVYCGMHHAFTRYLQAERLVNGRATEFMDRMGNILWRRFGQDVFLVALHKPDPCGDPGDEFARLCAPLGGTVDCAALRSGGKPVGFDILGSPIEETKLPAKSFYAAGHPLVRVIDFADGYVWQAPVDETRMVDLIPLAEYAPADADDAESRAKWEKHASDLANPNDRPSWATLSGWRAECRLPRGRSQLK